MKKRKKNLSAIFLLGTIYSVFCSVYVYLGNSVNWPVYFIGILGVISMLLCISSLIKAYQWKKFIIIIISAFMSLIFLGLVNYIAYKYDYRWDLTKAKQHTLSSETKKYIKSINKNLKLTALYVGFPPKYLQDMFEEYERVSEGKIKTEIIDPISNLGYAAKFGTMINGKERKVFVQVEGEGIKRQVDFSAKPLSEERLTNAIIKSLRKEAIIYFLTGHREYRIDSDKDTGLKKFVKLLAQNNIKSKQLLLGLKGDVPKDCDLLIIAGPKDNLNDNEVKKIQVYLKKGGDALFLVENVIVTTTDKPLTKDQINKNPSLNVILKDWGVKVANDIVVDLVSHAKGDVGSPATRNYFAHKAIVKGLDYTFYIRPRSISMIKGRRPTIKIAPLVATASYKQSWGETNRTLKVKFNRGVDREGPVPIAFVIFELKTQGDLSDTRIVVFTDADFLSNAYIDYYSNAQMGLNVANWLLESDYKVFLNPKEIKVEHLDLTSHQKKEITVILVLMPFLILIYGLLLWIRQK